VEMGSLELNIPDMVVLKFYYMKDGKTIYGGYVDDSTLDSSFRVIFVLEFKNKNTLINYPADINKNKILQVNKVNTIPRLQNIGIASFVYQLLAAHGFIILSDITQLDGGVGLWVKMAKAAHLNNYIIRIIDDEYGYKKDNAGNIIEYNGANIDTADIWTHGVDFAGEHILLMLTPKNRK
jgi:hypothetical protein